MAHRGAGLGAVRPVLWTRQTQPRHSCFQKLCEQQQHCTQGFPCVLSYVLVTSCEPPGHLQGTSLRCSNGCCAAGTAGEPKPLAAPRTPDGVLAPQPAGKPFTRTHGSHLAPGWDHSHTSASHPAQSAPRGPTWVFLSVWEFNLNIIVPRDLLDSGAFGAHD